MIITFEASRGAGAQSVTLNATDCGFDLFKFIFPLSKVSGVEASRSVEFHHSTSNVCTFRRRVGTKGLNTRFPFIIPAV